jgi:hypothetical protein
MMNLSCIQKGAYYTSIKILNKLPAHISKLRNEKSKFKVALREYVIEHSFYSLDEFFSFNGDVSPNKYQQ